MTDAEYVQLLIGDTTATVFTAAQIAEFLSRNGDDINLACADACFAIAMSARLLDKMEKIGAYTLDRKGLIKELHAMAKQFREAAESTPAHGYYEQAHTALSAREIISKEAMRDS